MSKGVGLPEYSLILINVSIMPFKRNFTYWIDKRRWKFYFLMVSLELDQRS